MRQDPVPSPTPTQQCSLNSTSTTPKLIFSVFPINCKVAGLQLFISPSHNPRSPSHTKISALPTQPASTPPVSQPSSIIQSCLRPRLTPLQSLPVTSRTEIPSQPPPSHPSAPPYSALPRPPTSEPRPLPRRLGQGRSLFPPPPTVTLRGSLTPSGPAVTLAQRPVGGASGFPAPPVGPPPAQSPPPGNVRGG